MTTEVLEIEARASNAAVIERAASALAAGALVAFPTETVYGLAANAAVASSVQRLTELKGATTRQPFTVHIGRREDVDDFVPEVPAVGRRLARKGWPGPLTLVFDVPDPALARIHSRLSAEGAAVIYVDRTVGVRFPDHAVTSSILSASKAPIIASSAGAPGRDPPTRGQDVREQLDGKVDLIVDGGATRYGRGSTIVAVDGRGYQIRRDGVYDERTVRRLATWTVLFVCSGNTCRSPIAEALCRRLLAERLGCGDDELAARGIVVRSAGTSAAAGLRASERAIEACRELNVDLSGHRSQPLTRELLLSADAIYAMAHHHLEAIAELAPEAVDRATLLAGDSDIEDPVGGPIEEYRMVAARIRGGLETHLPEMPS